MEPGMPLSVEEIGAELANKDKPLLNSTLIDLSNLSSEELRVLEQVWVAIEPRRRRQVMQRLVELAEDNFELNFDNIFISCLKDQDAGLRAKAIEGLWESEQASLIAPLASRLEQDSSEKVQVAAAIGLGKFVLLAEHNKLRPQHITRLRETLLVIVNDKGRSIEVRRRALEAAAPLSLPEVKTAITEAYHGQEPRLKASAIYAMGKNCDSTWLPIVLKELASVDAEIRYEAAGACGELGEEEAIPYLIPLIGDPDVDVQLAAIQALGKIGGAEAKKCLAQCRSNPSQAIREAAEQAASELETWEDPLSFRF